MHYLVGTTSVHTTAAICDYLDDRATSDDTVTVVAVTNDENGTARRDAQEALNVAPIRLATVGTVETELRETDDEPAAVLLEAATAVDADEILISSHGGTGDTSSGLCSTIRDRLVDASLPVIVVPRPEP
ncbi:universal stress protein [Natronolimnohabitans sp. A-GB9]|uniref:universal stress protein n=1 Tax=Natronolimnohabitans sp. A-GB9 TaxID=3069757 RepID=UPI0027B44941|nr:universal stress protein [Natronolimnohabitans sp. A-GB9]MDQ2052160.1 universal stress protein [Natronolimnohabitans sp. A-GB9]